MTKELKKVVNEVGEQVFAVFGENAIYRVYEDSDGDRFVKVGDDFESIKWFEKQRYTYGLITSPELESLMDKQGR